MGSDLIVINHQKIIRTGLLLSLTIVLQSLRLVIPIPPVLSIFLIGSLVNCCLLVAVQSIGLQAAVIIALIAPIIAYFQQILYLPIFIFPVALGSLLFIVVFYAIYKRHLWLGILSAAFAKTAALFYSFLWLTSTVNMPEKLKASLLFAMSWPQIITAVVGAIFSLIISKRLRKYNQRT
ncbi:hypothetical protein [Dendrosporobacter sp. 1207_IL3150]|uniref:hypothetical protein n=1 Tax=Dendrosporobacter sp. 1207_IL3150 TaxID=3084054 RepID=UPI002FDB359B